MDKLETTKQAKWLAFVNESTPFSNKRLLSNQLFDAGFDAGFACQGDWTAVEDGLPIKFGSYLWETKNGDGYCDYFVNGPIDIEFFTREYVAWREIPKYQPDGGEGE